MFINLSSEPSDKWTSTKREAAKGIGGLIKDHPFPHVPSLATTSDIQETAYNIVDEIIRTLPVTPDYYPLRDIIFLIQGEDSLKITLTGILQRRYARIFTEVTFLNGGFMWFREVPSYPENTSKL